MSRESGAESAAATGAAAGAGTGAGSGAGTGTGTGTGTDQATAAEATAATGAPPVLCPGCGTPAAAGARFCEECGTELVTAPDAADAAGATGGLPDGEALSTPTLGIRGGARRAGTATPGVPGDEPAGPRACAECGGEVDDDGYCTRCGTKAPPPRDHMVEQPAAWVASVSDRGVRHHRNEDAAATAVDRTWAALVVCDGVSSAAESDVASLAAARAARDVLVRERGAGLAQGSALTALERGRLEAAGAAAAAAVEASTLAAHGDSPPSCTFTAAVLDGARLSVGSVGDSRAYWLPDAGAPEVLTVDDSWAAEQVAAGVPRAEAESGPHAHAITRWLGVDADDQTPRVTHRELDAPGWVLVCSDGLWNYCSEATAAADVVARAAVAHGGEPLATAEALVRWANEQGGRDNITVALARFGGPTAGTDRGEPA